jgi:hypothetical protein
MNEGTGLGVPNVNMAERMQVLCFEAELEANSIWKSWDPYPEAMLLLE